jgi:hypothetical protein
MTGGAAQPMWGGAPDSQGMAFTLVSRCARGRCGLRRPTRG